MYLPALSSRLVATLPLILTVVVTFAQETPPNTPPDSKPGNNRPVPPKPGKPKPYEEVITSEAKTQKGLFTVHRIGENVYFEIPESAFNKEMLLKVTLSEVPTDSAYPGSAGPQMIVSWTRRENKVYLREVNHSIRSVDEDKRLGMGVSAATLQPILMAFDVETLSKDGSPVINATKMFTTDPSDFSVRDFIEAGGVDPSRSYIDQCTAFPINIETRALLTFNAGGGQPSRNPFAASGRSGTSSATVHYSLVMLPEKPMMGRLSDPRVGYFYTAFTVFGKTENRAVNQAYISRFRLEKKDPKAAISEPVKPIVFYLSREMPDKWRPYCKEGVEMWQKVFEKAGFKNAILCKDAPSLAEDPTWAPEDARYSVIRWAPSAIENAMGPSVQDPRSGETLSSHVIIWHNILKLIENWYFIQASPNDKRAQKLPLPDDLIGELLRYVVGHEIGHTLGLMHNFKASTAYTVAQLRDPEFTRKYGTEASIMDYGRYNYVAQPGDGASMVPVLGPYDYFAIEFGYKPVPGVKTPEDEKAELEKLLAQQLTNPALQFGTNFEDATVRTEDLGSDPVEATRLGLLNLDRVAGNLVAATTKPGQDYQLFNELYEKLIGQWSTELQHVTEVVGGYIETNANIAQAKPMYEPVPAVEQRRAVSFLLEKAFDVPRSFITPDIVGRIFDMNAEESILKAQRGILATLISNQRIQRMVKLEALYGANTYGATEFVYQLQSGIWRELASANPVVDVYRRNLQRAYIGMMKNAVAGNAQSELRPIARGALQDLATNIKGTLPKVGDNATRLHLQDALREIDFALNPVNIPQAPTAAPNR